MEVTTHEPGTFCWFELGTTDGPGAKAFYTELLGWDADDVSMDHGVYVMLSKEGKGVGALYELFEEQKEQGVRPHWLPYVSVEDMDATVEKATALGAEVLSPAMDVYDYGRMAVLKDPTGATIALWQPQQHHGVDLLTASGSNCWNELATTDREAAVAFYTALFGWGTQEQDMGEAGTYTIFTRGDAMAGGMMQMSDEWGEAPSHWMTYIAVDDCDATAEKVNALGGKVCVPPTDIPDVGRFAVLDDPQGAAFSILKPLPMPVNAA